jgi:hypothetical protein
MSTIEAPPSAHAEFKLEPPPGSTCSFTGNIINNADVDLVFVQAHAEGRWTQQPPARISANGGPAAFGNTDAMNAAGYVQYRGVVNEVAVLVTFSWSVPWIGSNHFDWIGAPGGVLHALQSGNTGGWGPEITWTVTTA